MPNTLLKPSPRLRLVRSTPGYTRSVTRGVKRLHHYKPGGTVTPRPEPRASTSSVPSAAAVPPPSPTSRPLTMGFDDNGLRGLGADTTDTSGFFSDLLTAYTAREQAKTAAAQAASAQAAAAQRVALRPATSIAGSTILGLTPTIWLILVGAGLGTFLLLQRKKRR